MKVIYTGQEKYRRKIRGKRKLWDAGQFRQVSLTNSRRAWSCNVDNLYSPTNDKLIETTQT